MPERKLWAEVVNKAIEDLRLPNRGREYEGKVVHNRESAYDFLFSRDPAYVEWRAQVFQMAGLDPDLDLSFMKPPVRGLHPDDRGEEGQNEDEV